jgi:starch phosphorylase
MDLKIITEIKEISIRDDSQEDNKSGTNLSQPLMRRGSSRGLFYQTGGKEGGVESIRPDFGFGSSTLYELMDSYCPSDEKCLMKSIVHHLEFTLARTRFSINNKSCYESAALSVRDRLIEIWNDTQIHITKVNPKRVYYLSIEYLMGRSFQNALLNLNIDSNMKKALIQLGMNMEEIKEEENDAGLGNGGLGRLAACYLDSLATQNLPGWGYGIRYNYGIFKQQIINGYQVEVPDFWIGDRNPWEIQRSDIHYKVRFYGNVRTEKIDGRSKTIWENYETVIAEAYDNPIPGFQTLNTINLRLWKSIPDETFNFARFNEGDYYSNIKRNQDAEIISSVLYPNDSTPNGKELRLKQQYFFVAATIQDILRRFKKSNKDFKDLPSFTAIQLNDTHPSLAIIELLRILVDQEGFEMLVAWNIVTNVFAYTNHTVLPEALEKWSVEIFGKLLPRHLELIYTVNFFWVAKISDICSGDVGKIERLSIIEESIPKNIRMANLSVLGSHKVNGVAHVHSEILKKTIFKDFYDLEPGKFINVTNGVTVRRWIGVANSNLAKLYNDYLGSYDFLVNFELVKNLLCKIEDQNFQNQWSKIKTKAKLRVIEWVKKHYRIKISEKALFDVMVKRFHEYKRQMMYLLYILHRYLSLKKMRNFDREGVVKRVFFIGGKAAPAYFIAKKNIKLAFSIADLVNNDIEVSQYIKLIFLPNYNVSMAELIIPASDISEHISIAGTEASGTSNMKFAMNGGLIIGTMDGANIEIADEVGKENMFIFGLKVEEVAEARLKVF